MRFFLIIALAIPAYSAESGLLCIAPAIFDPKDVSAPGVYCKAENFSVKIDGNVRPWPLKESVKITGLDLKTRHRVIVLCDRKPQQSFIFRFSDKADHLCLFLNDLYRTVQLSEQKAAPWCKCQ